MVHLTWKGMDIPDYMLLHLGECEGDETDWTGIEEVQCVKPKKNPAPAPPQAQAVVMHVEMPAFQCSESNINRLKDRLEACTTKPAVSINSIIVDMFEDLGIILRTLQGLPLPPTPAAV